MYGCSMKKQRGYAPPVVYVAIGSAIVIGLVSWVAYTYKLKFEASEANHALFVGQVTAMTTIIKKDIEIKEDKRARITSDLTEKNEKLKTDLNDTYADYQRLLNDKERAGSGGVPALSDTAESIDSPDAKARLNRAMEFLETGVLRDLARPRDEAVNRNIIGKEWVDQQIDVD